MVNTKTTTSKPTAASNKRTKSKAAPKSGKVSKVEDNVEQRDSSGEERCSKKCEREDADVTCDAAATKTSGAGGKKRRAPSKTQANAKVALSSVGEREGSKEQRDSSTTERAAAATTSHAGGKKRRAPSKSQAEPSLGRQGSDEIALQMLSAPTCSFDPANSAFPNLSSNSFGGLSFTGVPAAESNVSNTVDLGEPLTNLSMSQDQAWEILNQDSFGFNLGGGEMSLSFDNNEENLALPSPRMDERVNELTMYSALDGTSEDTKKSMDLTSAVTESIDGPSTPGKTDMETSIPEVAMSGGKVPDAATSSGKPKFNPFFPHGDFDNGYIPPTPPSTQSAPLASTLPRRRDSRDDCSRRSGHRSVREGPHDYDYYYDRPRHSIKSSGGKRSGTRSGSRRYHRSGEPLRSGSPPPLPNMGSAPSPRTRDDDMMGARAPDSKRYKSSSRSSRHPGDLPPFPPTSASHLWRQGPIRPSARYPQSPSIAAKGAPATDQGPKPMYTSPDIHPQSAQSVPPPVPMSQPSHPVTHPGFGYPFGGPPSHQVMNSPPPHPSGKTVDNNVPKAFLPPPPPKHTNKTSEHASSNAPPREVYILASPNGSTGNPNPSPFRHPLPPARGPYPYHPVPHHLPIAPPVQGAALLGSLTREQAPGIGWPRDEDLLLTECMANHKTPVDWFVIAREHDRGRTPRECHDRWTRYLKPGARKGQWREEEDAIVLRVIAQSGEPTFTQWADLAPQLPGRSGKQIRDRWVNYLNPAINHLPFNREDDLRLWEGHKRLGKRWVEISVKVFNSTRSENHIKNRWYSAAFKKFIANEFGPNAYASNSID